MRLSTNSETSTEVILYDASSSGRWLHCAFFWIKLLIRCGTNEEKFKSSTWRELKAVILTVKNFPGHFKNIFVILTDNQNVAQISEVGRLSMKPELHNLAMDCFLYRKLEVVFFVKIEWIPRTLNTNVDQYSELFDFDDWSVSDRIFHYLIKYGHLKHIPIC